VYKILKRNGGRMFSLDQTQVFLLPAQERPMQREGNEILSFKKYLKNFF
jgi:hypothetical protein